MAYVFIILLQLIGIGFHVAQKIVSLDKAYPEKTMKEIRDLFFENEWSSMIASFLVLFFNLVFQAIVDYYNLPIGKAVVVIPIIDISVSYIVASFLFALVLGYGGQTLAYKYLGRATEYLGEKADKK